jgi:MYXO-CTERM domain-containing protein
MHRLAFVLCLLPLAATAAPHTVLYRHPSEARPAFVAGDLSGPTSLAPEVAARAFLRGAPDLAPVPIALLGRADLRHLGDATIVRFELTHAGLPIVDTNVVLRLDARGRVRMVAGRPLHLERVGTATPTLSAADAQERLAATHAPLQASAVRSATPRLVWLPRAGGGLRLAWEVRLQPVPVLSQALLYRVDAHTGAMVTARNLVRFADQGKVYVVDPTTDGTTTTQTLADRAPGTSDPPDALFNSLIKIVNCIDNHKLVPINFGGYNISVHVCDEIPSVVHDANGDYLQYEPVLGAYSAEASAVEDATSCLTKPGCDAFAEVNAYWHIMKAYKYFQAFNDPNFVHETVMPLQVSVNYRFPIDMMGGGFDIVNATNANGKLYGADNSWFMQGQLIPGLGPEVAIQLFQGTHHDMSYDATVTYHEFTHSVMWSMRVADTPFTWDEQGLDFGPWALAEAFADTFASLLSGKFLQAGYAFDWYPGAPRDLKNTRLVCPDDLEGQQHWDGQQMSEAIWSIHNSLGADSEKPIFTAIAGLPVDATFAETVAAVESAIDDALGATAKATAHGFFLDHGVVDCRRIINYTGPRASLNTMGTSETGLSPVTPGFLQFKYTLAERAQSLRVAFDWSASAESMLGGGGTPNYSVYVRKGSPITWDYSGDPTGTKDYEFALTGENQNANWSGDLAQLLDPGDYYVMVVSTGAVGGTLQDITISHVPAPQDDAGPPPQEDAGTGADGGDDNGGRKGCDCRAASGAPAGLGLLALLGLALLVRRRR